MAEGHNNQQIAALIGLAANSVRNMVSVINSKLDAENRMDAILKWRIQAGKSSYDGLGVQ